MTNIMIKNISPSVVTELDTQAKQIKKMGQSLSRNQLAKLILENEMKRRIVRVELAEIEHLAQSIRSLTDALEKVVASNTDLLELLLTERRENNV